MEERTSVVASDDESDDVTSDVDYDETFEPEEFGTSFPDDVNADDSLRLMTEQERRKIKVSVMTSSYQTGLT